LTTIPASQPAMAPTISQMISACASMFPPISVCPERAVQYRFFISDSSTDQAAGSGGRDKTRNVFQSTVYGSLFPHLFTDVRFTPKSRHR
jgi:hypothetical protein